MTFSKTSKTLKLPQKHTKAKNLKKNEKVIQGGLKSKNSENKAQLELKNINNDIFKNFKNSK